MAAMNVRITDTESQDERYDLFDVHFYTDTIKTTVTSHPQIITQWINETTTTHSSSRQLMVGLDVEWRPNFQRNQQNPVATLQICVDRRCLIIQLIYCKSIPESLIDFIGNREYKFVGVGIESDVEKLLEDYDMSVKNVVDVRGIAAEKYGMRSLKNGGLKELCSVVLEKEIVKPKSVTMGRWDSEWLSLNQIQYACLDAFVSFEIARHLNVGASASAAPTPVVNLLEDNDICVRSVVDVRSIAPEKYGMKNLKNADAFVSFKIARHLNVAASGHVAPGC